MENKEIKDLLDGVTFKFKELNPVELINLVTKNLDFGKTDKRDDDEKFINKVLTCILWTKDGSTWNPLVQEDGEARLPELKSKPTVSLDLFYKFRSEVLAPVFYESKTFQTFMNDNIKKQEK